MRMGGYFTRKAEGVSEARVDWLGVPPFVPRRLSRKSSAKAAGLRYERKIQSRLSKDHQLFLPHLVFAFHSSYGRERCIPDGVAISTRDPSLLTIIEIKLRHTEDAWYQLNDLYLPVVRKALPNHKIQLLEICKFYDPAIKLPGPFTLVYDVEAFIEKGGSEFAVCPWAHD